jgi:DNA repair exonuclease SbcCD ATPase subunit
MSSPENPSPWETLARRLTELAPRVTRAEREPELDLAARSAELDETLAVRRGEVASLEERLRALDEEERRLAEEVSRRFTRLKEHCRELIDRLPLLETPALEAWFAWLESWHRSTQRPFGPVADWQAHFETRPAVDDAMDLIAPILADIERLDVGSGEEGFGYAAIPAEIGRAQEELSRLETEVATRLAAVAPIYGRIVQDLPDPGSADSATKLERIEALLLYLEGKLGSFAASARIERQMLETL